MDQKKARDHADYFLWREEREKEDMAREIGREAVGRFDQLLVRELLHERKHAEVNRMFGIEPSQKTYDVVVTMRGAAVHPQASLRGLEARRRHVEMLRKSSALLVSRLAESADRDGIVVTHRFWIVPAARMTATAEQVQKIGLRSDVQSITLDKQRLATCLDGSRVLIGADQVQALGFTGAGVTVAIIDTGVDSAHVALAGVVTSQTDLTGSDGSTAEGIGDMVGHGTHCAGIVASQDATFRGIAPGALIADIKIMRNNGAGGGTSNPTIMVNGIQAAVTAGVNVASCSWGISHAGGAWADPPAQGQRDGTCVLCTAVDAAVTAGVTFVIAAGNEDNDTCSSYDTHLRCPALAANAITVAASDKKDKIADFSSVGPTPDGRAKPDITAPGVSIGSCRASGTSMGSPIDANFTRADGTSMACPHVAAVAALMLSKTGTLTPATIKSTLMSTTVDIGAPSIQEGAGRVDALAAVNAS
jgi:serine protease AprX